MWCRRSSLALIIFSLEIIYRDFDKSTHIIILCVDLHYLKENEDNCRNCYIIPNIDQIE